VLVVVNLDPAQAHSGWLELPLAEFNLGANIEVRDLLTDERFTWQGPRIYIELDPNTLPAHVFLLR
jgi:starch synthase (maltosyl-transferring)